jgi:hypothetical protein
MRAAQLAHDDVIRTVIEEHGGLPVQPHRRRGGRGVRIADVCGGCSSDPQRALELPHSTSIASISLRPEGTQTSPAR